MTDAAIPAALVPAVTIGADALLNVPMGLLTDTSDATAEQRQTAALTMFRQAIDAKAIVARADYDDLEQQNRQLLGRLDRVSKQMEHVGGQRQRAEQLCHDLAEALATGVGGDSALAAYRSAEW